MRGMSRKDFQTLGNGFWMTLGSLAGEMKHSLAYFGVMELVRYSYISIL